MDIQTITITQGSTFEWLILMQDVNGLPLDMVTYTPAPAGVRGSIRRKYADTTPVVSFVCSILNKTGVLAAKAASRCHMTTAQETALLDDSVGSCYALLILEAAVTAAMTPPKDKNFPLIYDVEVEDATGYVFKPYSGVVSFGQEVTK